MRFRLNLRDHWLFSIFLGIGVILRVLAVLAYRPALLLQSDAYVYLQKALELEPSRYRPVLYSIFLKPFVFAHSIATAAIAQHLLGLGLAVLLYIYLRRVQVGPLLAALGPAPLLLDAYQVNIEHYILAETLFQVLSAGGLLVLVWGGPTAIRSVGAGVLLGLSALTRFLGLTLVVPAAVSAWRRASWRSPILLLAAAALPLLAYAAWFSSVFGDFSITNRDGAFLYGRVAGWVDCEQLRVPDYQRVLCDPRPPSERDDANRYVFREEPPGGELNLPDGVERDDALGAFALAAIRQQPMTYLRVVGSGTAHYFAPVRSTGPQDNRLVHWRFPLAASDTEPHAFLIRRYGASPPSTIDPARFRIVSGPARVLRAYQSVAYMHGPLLLAICIGAVASLFVGRGAHGGSDLRPHIALWTASGLLLLVVPVATVTFDYRFMLLALPMLPVAGALGVHQIRGSRAKA